MKQKILRKAVVLFLAAVLSVNVLACNNEKGEDAKQIQSLIEEVNAQNKERNAPESIPNDIFYVENPAEEKWNAEDLKLWEEVLNGKETVTEVSKDTANMELDWLLRLLRAYYANYERAGGDEYFKEAKSKVMKSFDEAEVISQEQYADILKESFNYEGDYHFAIGGAKLPDRKLLCNEDVEFYKKGDNYYTDSKMENEVLLVSGKSLSVFIKHKIDGDGKLSYGIYLVGEDGEKERKVQLKCKNGTETVKLTEASYLGNTGILSSKNTYEKEEKGKVPVQFLSFFDKPEEKGMSKFLKETEEIKEQPYALLDVSRNNGGYDTTLYTWFQKFTGESYQSNGATFQRNFDSLPQREEERENNALLQKMLREQGMKTEGDYEVLKPANQFMKAGNRKLLFMLTSRDTASCAELMSDAARNLENTIIIGTNTIGGLSGDMLDEFFLPYTGTSYNFGTRMFYWEEDYFREGVGFAPDVYLTGDNCEERLEQFLAYYTPLVNAHVR